MLTIHMAVVCGATNGLTVQTFPKLQHLTFRFRKRKGHILRFCPDRVIPNRFQKKGIKCSFNEADT